MNHLWESMTAEETVRALATSVERGLSEQEAAVRLKARGANELDRRQGRTISPVRLFLSQFNDFMVWVLAAASLVSGYMNEWLDAGAILVIVALNGVFGFIQEYRAERALGALSKLSSPQAKVLRDGEMRMIAARDLTVGDIVALEAGDRVPADGRLLSAVKLQTDESLLSGESTPVDKTPSAAGGTDGERVNMVVMGAGVLSGRAVMAVTAVGMQTALGRIAVLMGSAGEDRTPLQKRLEDLGRWLVYICLVIVLVIFVLGIARGVPVMEMFLTSVCLAVAAIPEGLAAVVTIALAIGVQRMARRNALVRKLPSVETLGSVTVICSDKTGTLTQNEMTMRRILAGGREYVFQGEGYDPHDGAVSVNGMPADTASATDLRKLLETAALCSSASLIRGEAGRWIVMGDPTEGALLAAAGKAGIWKADLERGFPIVQEVPFDPRRKMMTVIRRASASGAMVCVKGATDAVLARCGSILIDGQVRVLDAAQKDMLAFRAELLAGQALRVLAVAFRNIDGDEASAPGPDRLERDLVFVGLAGMMDPGRPEARSAVSICREAGIRTIMITGDARSTAGTVARDLGIVDDPGAVLTGMDLDGMDEGALRAAVRSHTVFAKVSAEQKLRIVKALRQSGEIVAVTGDDVTDAPALTEADIGIAMGRSGKDVAREAAAMIINDDNFATIVTAIREGRIIYDNIRKFVFYLLSCNSGEILVVFVASLAGWPLPLLPLQILWTNLITDGFPALALGMEEGEPDIMSRPRMRAAGGMFTREFVKRMITAGLLVAATSLFVFWYSLFVRYDTVAHARTMAFAVLVCSQLFHAFNCRSEVFSVWKLGLASNRLLFTAVLVSLALQFGVVHIPGVNALFQTMPLSLWDWAIVIGVSSVPLWVFEGIKAVSRARSLRRRLAEAAASHMSGSGQ